MSLGSTLDSCACVHLKSFLNLTRGPFRSSERTKVENRRVLSDQERERKREETSGRKIKKKKGFSSYTGGVSRT